jgi:hypothetical protein
LGSCFARGAKAVTLNHVGLWEVKTKPPIKGKAPSPSISLDDLDSQVPFSAPSFYANPIYPADYNRISNPRWVTPMVIVSAIFLLFSGHQECFDMISNYSIGNPDF